MMIRRSYRLTFVAPAFLGNAEQSGQWRTPPVKALLRQWWRVAHAASHHHQLGVNDLRVAEARLFGTVDGEARRSLVRIRLARWVEGRLKVWDTSRQKTVAHPEVQQTGRQVDPQLYLGFGPLIVKKGSGTVLKGAAAIQAEEFAALSLAWPDGEHTRQLDSALALMSRYGALGGRSRNGWGSMALRPVDSTPPFDDADPACAMRDWKQALRLDWAHSIGRDDHGPLIWQTPPCPDWQAAMRLLAESKIGLRTMFRFSTGDGAKAPEDRHWLSYPVTKHRINDWERPSSLRLPNTLRLKLRPAIDGKVVGVIFHMPCKPPPAFGPDAGTLERIWQRVHEFLDAGPTGMKRIPA